MQNNSNTTMKLLYVTILIFFSLTGLCDAQHKAIIDNYYLADVAIYDKINGQIITQMKNDSIEEDFLQLTILKQTKTHFYVQIGHTIKVDSTYGWIQKAKYIGAYLKNENFPMDLILYKKKIESEKNIIFIKNWKPELLTIEKYDGDWIYVSNVQNGIKYEGWIKAERLCANPYSTCS